MVCCCNVAFNRFFIFTYKKFEKKTIEEFKNYKKSEKYYVGLFLIFMPMFMELPDKLAILFYNVEESYKKSEIYRVEISGYLKTGTGRQGGNFWATAKNLTGRQERYVLICNLVSLVECDLGDLKGDKAVVMLSRYNNYPLKNKSVVYGFKSKGLNVDDNYFINLYKENKKYIFYFLFYFYIPSICFSLVVPKSFK